MTKVCKLFYENKKSKFYKTKISAPLIQGPRYATDFKSIINNETI